MNQKKTEGPKEAQKGLSQVVTRRGEGGAVFLLYLHCTDVRWSALEHLLSGALMISTC